MHSLWRRTASILAALTTAGSVPALRAQTPLDAGRIAIVYSGRSLGALGSRRSQDEHELLTEQARQEGLPFKLVSHRAWRAPGITIFLPGTEPEGDELEEIISRRAEAERLADVAALVSSTGLLLQDPWRPAPDLLAMLRRNPRAATDFADLAATRVTVSRLRTREDDRAIIVEEPGAIWPTDLEAWTLGEMNRVDVADARIFELPRKLGELGPRATLLRQIREDSLRPARVTITVDLGHRDGDLGINRVERSRLDFLALATLGYRVVVPFEAELGLGIAALTKVAAEFPSISLLAANVRTNGSNVFRASTVVDEGGLRIGLIGIVQPAVRDRLPRSALVQYTFDDPIDAVRREVVRLREQRVQAIVVLSNLEVGDNARVAESVPGIDAIIADMPLRSSPEAMRVRVELPDRPFVRPGVPALVARSAANGARVGRLDLELRRASPTSTPWVAAVEHRTYPVTDATPSDTAVVRRIQQQGYQLDDVRGELLIPSFGDLAAVDSSLALTDSVTRQGRISKPMWEGFLARQLRVRGNAEVSVIRRLDEFPPLIGKLHEREVDEWLWSEDELVLVDIPGNDLRRLLSTDSRNELATSGYDRATGTILGRRIDDATFYRVATTDVLFEGSRAGFFAKARRVRRNFRVSPSGILLSSSDARGLSLREFIFGELQRIRRSVQGDAQVAAIAALLAPDPSFENLFAFSFERPTVWASLNEVNGNDAYNNVPESRVISQDAWVIGASGRIVATHERRASATDFGLGFAFGEQHLKNAGSTTVIETADDIKFDLTLRPSLRGDGPQWQPFVRGLFDTEFTPTVDPTGRRNARQLALRGIGGLLRRPTATIRRAEAALIVENDFGRPNVQFGVQLRADVARSFSGLRRREVGGVTYRLFNDLTYLLPARLDTDQNLALRYSQIHEVIVPLVDELSLTVAADLLLFQGKVAATRTPGTSALLRVGLTYDRLWKPRYQPFF